METFRVKTSQRTEFVSITQSVSQILSTTGIKEGACIVYVPHTTAAVTINENADPAVPRDVISELNKVIPFNDNYTHLEGNSAAHIKASLIGPSVYIPVTNGNLSLGTWQGIFFCEFDGPRNRTVFVQVVKA
ncbi:MAG: YjbQ family protein [Spirochaetales bacterium]|nr:YjbQ family protein [Spirochaetales bacterium]